MASSDKPRGMGGRPKAAGRRLWRVAALAVAGTAAAAPAHADFFDDVRRTFQKDIPRTFQEDIPRAFGATPKKSPEAPGRKNLAKPPAADQNPSRTTSRAK